MNLSNYDKEIRDLADELFRARSKNDPIVMRYSSALIRRGGELGDHALLGFAYYYLAESCFLFGHSDRYRRNLVCGMKYQQEMAQDDLLARSYNLIAIDAMNHGSTDLGLGYFLRAQDLCEKCRDRYQSGLIRMNIAMVYVGSTEKPPPH